MREAREWLEGMLARAPNASPAVRARALQRAGVLGVNASDTAAPESYLEQALDIFRSLGDDTGVAWTLAYQSALKRHTGDMDGRKARREESLALARRLGDRRLIAIGVSDLASIADDEGDLDRALTLGEEGLAMNREIGNLQGAGVACYNLSVVERKRGNLERAFERCGEALSVFLALGDRRMVATALAGFGAIAHMQGQDDRAVRLFAAFRALAEECGYVPDPVFLDVVDRGVAEARQSLGDAAFEDAWAAGQSMSFDEAHGYALQAVSPVRS
jgi:tetratricopeptide (TPR) repeat protein